MGPLVNRTLSLALPLALVLASAACSSSSSVGATTDAGKPDVGHIVFPSHPDASDAHPKDAHHDATGSKDAGVDVAPEASLSDGGFTTSPVCTTDWCWENPSPQGNALASVWGSSASDVWAVGLAGTVLHWNGSTWSGTPNVVASPDSGAPVDLTSVWGSSSTDVWAVGDLGTIAHWDGTAWSPSPSGTTLDLAAVWGSSSTDVWAVGAEGMVLHWTGTSWSGSQVGFFGSNLYAVWGVSASDVWAVGDSGTFEHWNGSHWDDLSGAYELPQGAQPDSFVGVWGSSSTDVWAVGAGGSIVHWAGAAWAIQQGPSFSGGFSPFDGIWGSGTDDVWAVGSNDATLPLERADVDCDLRPGASVPEWCVGERLRRRVGRRCGRRHLALERRGLVDSDDGRDDDARLGVGLVRDERLRGR